jgi:hypothetical protein
MRQGEVPARVCWKRSSACAEGWTRLWLITSLTTTPARYGSTSAGWDWVDFRRDGITRGRQLKPEIPETGNHGIALRHEIEFEFPL